MKKKKLLDYSNLSDEDYEKELKKFLVSALRRVSLYWKPRNEAFKHARVERGVYRCAKCQQLFGRKDVVADHKDPAVALDGFNNWEDYVKRMFPKAQGFQVLCVSCHTEKTKTESIIRKIKRNIKKSIDNHKKK